jgi:hypothetical protein
MRGGEYILQPRPNDENSYSRKQSYSSKSRRVTAFQSLDLNATNSTSTLDETIPAKKHLSSNIPKLQSKNKKLHANNTTTVSVSDHPAIELAHNDFDISELKSFFDMKTTSAEELSCLPHAHTSQIQVHDQKQEHTLREVVDTSL